MMDLKKESAVSAILITPENQEFFIKNIDRWKKYYNMEHYNEGGGGICWNRKALETASLEELIDIINALSMYKCKKQNSFLYKLKRVFKMKTSS